MQGHTAAVNSVWVNDERLISASADGSIKLWNLTVRELMPVLWLFRRHNVFSISQNGDVVRTIPMQAPVEAICCANDVLGASHYTFLAVATSCVDTHFAVWLQWL